MKDAIKALLIIAVLVVMSVWVKEANAHEYKVGLSMTVPLNFRDVGERGTMTMYVEAYEADRYNSYTAIDNSVTTVDNSTSNRTTNRTTTNTTTTQTITNSTNNSTSVSVHGSCNNVHVK